MVDREARNRAVDALRDFLQGSISNKEYERRYPRSKDDPVIWEIYVQAWFFYSDVSEHALTGKHALNEENRSFFERSLLFLASDFEFQWPRQKFRPWHGILRLLGLSRRVKRWEDEELSIGDRDVWPFFRKADYEMMRAITGG